MQYLWEILLFIREPNLNITVMKCRCFQGGNQWRWIDLQSFRFQSDRIAKVDYLKNGTLFRRNLTRTGRAMPYYFYADNNGKYFIQTTDLIDAELAGGLWHVYGLLLCPRTILLSKERIFICWENLRDIN